MRVHGLILATAAAAALTAAAHGASAQVRESDRAAVQASPTVRNDLVSTEADAPRRGLRWNEEGRWGLDLNLNQPIGREADWSDVQAGAYYRLNPRLRVGAAASLSEPQTDPARPVETDRRAQPRVRLETIFKF